MMRSASASAAHLVFRPDLVAGRVIAGIEAGPTHATVDPRSMCIAGVNGVVPTDFRRRNGCDAFMLA
jgi:hypothetical protein